MNITCENCGHTEKQESLGAIATTLEYGCEACLKTNFKLTDDRDNYLCHCFRDESYEHVHELIRRRNDAQL
jgi:hypothetical protein